MFTNPYIYNFKIAVFDIETLGLDPENGMVISASFCDLDGGGLRQYFCDDKESEFLLLTKIIEELSHLDAIITYNGSRFDIPYIYTRAKKYDMIDDIPFVWNIDMYKYIRGYWPASRLLSSLSQMSVENALGIFEERTDRIKGEECISKYNSYLISGNESLRNEILLHNADDVRQLAKITEKMTALPYHQIVFELGRLLIFRPDYPMADDVKLWVNPVKMNFDNFELTAQTAAGFNSVSCSEEYYALEYDSFCGAIKLSIITKTLEDYLYVDLKKIPVDEKDFEDLNGYSSGYLILKQANKINYRELNRLVSEILRTVIE